MLARFKAFFDKASWRLCARLRANQTWKEASPGNHGGHNRIPGGHGKDEPVERH